MATPLLTHDVTQLSAISHQAVLGSNNPFITPPVNTQTWPPSTVTWPPTPIVPQPPTVPQPPFIPQTPILPQPPVVPHTPVVQNWPQPTWPQPTWPQTPVHNRHYVPPQEQQAIQRGSFNRIYSLTDNDNDDRASTATSSQSMIPPSAPPPARQHLLWPDLPNKRIIKEKTMAGVPPWPTDLRLSLNANNWLEWSRRLLASLSMGQLDIYPLGTLPCPERATDLIGCENWQGNDRMVLGFMMTHMFPAESQYIATCSTSAEAYALLRQRHEKRSGLTVIQILQRMMQTRFDPSVDDTDTNLVLVRDLIYSAEMIGPVDYTKLALLFMKMNIRTSHPSVHEALAPALMDGTLTLTTFERRLSYFHELRITHSLENLAFTSQSAPPSAQSSPTSQTVALPAYPLRANICPNCKRLGHSIEFCISPGGKMEGFSPSDAIARQRAVREGFRTRPPAPPIAPSVPAAPHVKLDNDGAVWVNGVKYHPPPTAEKASVATADVEAAMTAADQGEYEDWAVNNNTDWGNGDLLDTATFLLAAADTALLGAQHNPPLYLDSGASTHISCVRSDFLDLADMEPRTIMGVGNSTVSAIGIGTIGISLPETSARITLRRVLYAPTAGVRLVSISRLDDSGYKLSFSDGRCTVRDRLSNRTLAECTRNSSNLYVLPGSIIPSSTSSSSSSPPSLPPSIAPHSAFPSLVATPNLETWHRRLGHPNYRTVLDMVRNDSVSGMKTDLSTVPQACDACIRGKQTHHPVPKSREGNKAEKRLGRIYVDLTGPQSVLARSGCSYVMNIIDDYSGYHWTRLLKAKSDAARVLREWLEAAEIQSGERLCYLVSDNGELRSNDMARWCAERGITHLFTAPHTSAQNGRVERLHRTLMNKARAMRLSCDAPLQMWDEFILTASYLSTLTASKAANDRTPYELWFGSHPSVAHLREIGSRAYVLVSAANPKIAARSVECVLIGYASNSKAYRCWHRESGRIVDSYHVTFVEHLNDQPRVSQRKSNEHAVPDADEGAIASPPAHQPAVDSGASPLLDGTGMPSPPTGESTNAAPRRSTRNRVPAPSREDTNDGLVHGGASARALKEVREAASRHATAKANAKDSSTVGEAGGMTDAMPNAETVEFASQEEVVDETALLVDVEDPDAPDWREALESDERDKWIEGAEAELTSLRDMGVYQVVPRSDVPSNRSILRGKFVCRLKRDELGTPVRYKVRWVAKGFQQVWGRDFSKTTSPTARLESLRVALHIAAVNDWHIEQYDVKTAFLNGILPEEERQYMEQPPGFLHPGKEDHVWQLHRGLYGMRQSSRIWNRALHDSFLGWGFTRSECEWCVYWRRSDNGDMTIVVLHVDDMAAISSTEDEVKRFRSELEATWQITALGEPKLIVGLAVRRDRPNRTIMLSQTALIDKIISVYGQKDANPASTPILHGAQLLTPDPREEPDADERERLAKLPYRSLVGSLMYVASGTRPDIMFAVSKLSRFLSCYREIHWQAAVRVVRYLKGTRDMELRLGGSSTSLSLVGYCDSDYANDPGREGRRSVAGHCFSLGSGMVSWSSKKQKTLADSTCAAEYMAASEAGRELVWLRTLLGELGFGSSLPTPLLCDNSAAVVLCGDQAFHNRVKHLDVKYHWIRERVDNGELIVGRIPSSGNIADILTKALPGPLFTSLRGCLGVHQRRTGIRAEGECEDSSAAASASAAVT
jgi:hypothetical protein